MKLPFYDILELKNVWVVSYKISEKFRLLLIFQNYKVIDLQKIFHNWSFSVVPVSIVHIFTNLADWIMTHVGQIETLLTDAHGSAMAGTRDLVSAPPY